MAGDDPNHNKNPPSPPSSPQCPDDENPFIAFRRFADEQISSMLQSVMGIPSVVSSPRTDHWTIFTEEQSYKDARQRQNQEPSNDGKEQENPSGAQGSGNSNTPAPKDTGAPPSERSRPRWSEPEAPFPRHHHSGKYASGPSDLFDIDLFFDSFLDRFWFDDYVSSRFLHPYHRPLFANMLSDDSPAWPVPYLMFSPYSPLHLERQAHYHSHRDQGVFSSLMSSLSLSSECDPDEPKWREAFEDLLRLENGKPMLDRDLTSVAKSESGKEWLHNLVKRGSLGEQWKYVAETDSQPWSTITFDHRPNRARDNQRSLADREEQDGDATREPEGYEGKSEPASELDMYERFLADIEAREREREHFLRAQHSPLLRLLLEDRQRLKDDILYPEQDYRSDDTENWLELVSGGKKNSVPDSVEENVGNVARELPESSPESLKSQNQYVVSTQTRTERVRLPDGSIQTKTVKTQRFADGREETNESLEVVKPPQRDQDSSGQEQPSPTDQKKNGWFWKE